MNMNTVDSAKGRLKGTYIAIMIPIGVAINYIGGIIASSLSLPIYLDSIGTVIVAAIMGPWVGAASGALYNIVSSLISGNIMASMFAICNIGSGLIVGYMARKNHFKSITDVIVATVLVALWNAITGAPIAMVVYGGIDGNAGTNLMIAGLNAMGTDLANAAFLARIPVNLVDKGIASVIAWIVYKRLPDHLKTLNGSTIEK
ncbi:MAG: ECF transporter S component [Halanaerobiales bacterium]